jgi:hypothetical protein
MKYALKEIGRGLYVVENAYTHREEYFSTGVKPRMSHISDETKEAIRETMEEIKFFLDQRSELCLVVEAAIVRLRLAGWDEAADGIEAQLRKIEREFSERNERLNNERI